MVYKLCMLSFVVGIALLVPSHGFVAGPGALPLSKSPMKLARSPKPAMKMLDIPSGHLIMAQVTNLLLAVDSDSSYTDRLYNMKPLTGNVEAPPLALPLLAVLIGGGLAIAVPLLLKPGTDAFNEGRSDVGVMTDKKKDRK